MALPRGNEYQESIQNPHVSFNDSELKASRVERDNNDLPKPYSGGFTVTYRMQSGTNVWAVRCFTREVQDLQRRYQAIGSFLSRRQSKYFVTAIYLSNGIRVAGVEYPIIKMKWLDGESLNLYLSKNYSNKNAVDLLLADFLSLVKELESNSMAHGDLQHGNILVKHNQLYLIDYDGMFLPELSGLTTNEVGHINYQHPQRLPRHFNKDIDRFASIIIYIGLKAISIRPTLWKKYDNGENLLFKQNDFADLQNSQLIRDLLAIQELAPLVKRFLGVCYLEFDKIPSLSEFINGTFVFPSIELTHLRPIEITRSQYLVIDGTQKGTILEHVGERVEIVGKITALRQGYTKFGAPFAMLNMGRAYPNHSFTLVLWSETINTLQSAGIDPKSYKEQWISVIGVISQFKGRPQLYIEQPTQLRILSDVREAQMLLVQKSFPPSSRHTKSQIPTTGEKPYPPSSRATGTSKTGIEEIDVLIGLYGNRPVSTSPSSGTQTTKGQKSMPYASQPSSTQGNQPTNTSSNAGCAIASTFLVIGGTIGWSVSESLAGILIGAFFGWFISLFFTK